jgi:hypothetical protein
MARYGLLVGSLCIIVLLVGGMVVQASNVVTFQVEVLPGLRIANPGTLTFSSVAPGQTVLEDLNLTVWSNVNWELLVKAVGLGTEEGFRGGVELNDFGYWRSLSDESMLIHLGQKPTGAEGLSVQVPFRLTGSYEDAPGNYSFQVEFTVVPSL